jgi:hypothetical protein
MACPACTSGQVCTVLPSSLTAWAVLAWQTDYSTLSTYPALPLPHSCPLRSSALLVCTWTMHPAWSSSAPTWGLRT